MTSEARRRSGDLPIDPDLDAAEDPRHRSRRSRVRRGARERRFRPGVLAAIAAGGALGGGGRYLIEQAAPAARAAFPWATFAINVAGSFALAVLLVFILDVWPPTRYLRPFAAIGFLGSFTTFSTWMVETTELLGDDRAGLALGYLAGSVVAGLAAVSLGLVLGRAVVTRRSRATGRT
jgi:fluoride exporter